MAVTKILARKGRLNVGVRYVLNGGKTQEQILTARLNCDPGREVRQMLETKRDYGKEDGIQYYHMILSFRPGELTPELALDIAREFAEEHLPGYQAVIGVHVDKAHIHAHILFNSVNADTGEKYHSNARSYYQQIRAVSDRLCLEHGLSVIVRGEPAKAVSYIEWLRQSKDQPTFRSLLEADLREAIQDANDLGHFFLLMEHKGYEIRHGNRLGFRLRGQERFMVPGRKDPLFTEEGIRAAIQGNLSAIEAGRRQEPPRMTPQLRQAVMKAERYRAQFAFLRENGITGPDDMAVFFARTEESLASLTKQRTILNVRKKKRVRLYKALADAEALAPAKALYEDGLSGMEAEFAQYLEAAAVIERSGIPRGQLMSEKAAVYQQLAELNRQIRQERKNLALCREIMDWIPQMEKTIQSADELKKEVERDEHRRR